MQPELGVEEEAAVDQSADHRDYQPAPARDEHGRGIPGPGDEITELVSDLILRPPLSPTRKPKESKSVRPRAGQNFKSPPVGAHGIGEDLRELRLQKKLTKDTETNYHRAPRGDYGGHTADARQGPAKGGHHPHGGSQQPHPTH